MDDSDRSHAVPCTSPPTSRTFKAVRLPDTTLTGSPAPGAVVASHATDFHYASPTGTSFRCVLDGNETPCAANLAPTDGVHTLRVAAGITPFDAVATYFDLSPAVRSWTVDTRSPDTSIVTGAPARTSEASATIAFAGSDPAPATPVHFRCALDAGTATPCTSPVSYSRLAPGTHAVTVTAVDAAGNADPSPAVDRWTVLRDADGDRYDEEVDCNDADPTVHPGAPEILDDGIDQNYDGDPGVNHDRDGDGFTAQPLGLDCDDANAKINPAAKERPGNKVDENCDGVKAPWPEVNPVWRYHAVPDHGATRFDVLGFTSVPAKGVVILDCRGRGCQFAHKRVRVRTGKASPLALVKHARFGSGAVLTLTVSAPRHAARIWRYRVGKPGKATVVVACREPGAKKTYTCRI